jgi:hypothetical protein
MMCFEPFIISVPALMATVHQLARHARMLNLADCTFAMHTSVDEQATSSGLLELGDVRLSLAKSESRQLKRRSVCIMVFVEVLPQLCTVVVLWHMGQLPTSAWSVAVVGSAAMYLLYAATDVALEYFGLQRSRQYGGGDDTSSTSTDRINEIVDPNVVGAPTWL